VNSRNYSRNENDLLSFDSKISLKTEMRSLESEFETVYLQHSKYLMKKTTEREKEFVSASSGEIRPG
jgi:hypothetical protein